MDPLTYQIHAAALQRQNAAQAVKRMTSPGSYTIESSGRVHSNISTPKPKRRSFLKTLLCSGKESSSGKKHYSNPTAAQFQRNRQASLPRPHTHPYTPTPARPTTSAAQATKRATKSKSKVTPLGLSLPRKDSDSLSFTCRATASGDDPKKSNFLSRYDDASGYVSTPVGRLPYSGHYNAASRTASVPALSSVPKKARGDSRTGAPLGSLAGGPGAGRKVTYAETGTQTVKERICESLVLPSHFAPSSSSGSSSSTSASASASTATSSIYPAHTQTHTAPPTFLSSSSSESNSSTSTPRGELTPLELHQINTYNIAQSVLDHTGTRHPLNRQRSFLAHASPLASSRGRYVNLGRGEYREVDDDVSIYYQTSPGNYEKIVVQEVRYGGKGGLGVPVSRTPKKTLDSRRRRKEGEEVENGGMEVGRVVGSHFSEDSDVSHVWESDGAGEGWYMGPPRAEGIDGRGLWPVEKEEDEEDKGAFQWPMTKSGKDSEGTSILCPAPCAKAKIVGPERMRSQKAKIEPLFSGSWLDNAPAQSPKAKEVEDDDDGSSIYDLYF